jgi:hypothetical protein
MLTIVGTPVHPREAPAAHRPRFPVGARFPRIWTATDIEPVRLVRPENLVATVFPMGCRFPRRTAADARTYLATAGSGRPITSPATLPVGARFPRRARPSTTDSPPETGGPTRIAA